MTNTIVFENNVQKALWDRELAGQISDGYWENASPADHWKPWSGAETKVAVDGEPVGRNFWAQKENYNLNSAFLLDCVGDRMLVCAKLAMRFPEFEGDFPDGSSDFDLYRRIAAEGGSQYFADRVAEWEAAGITEEIVREVENDDSYTMKDLKKELTRMKKVIRTRI